MSEEKLQQITETVIPLITTYGLRILGAVLILIVGRIVSGLLGSLADKALRRADVDVTLRGFLVSMVKIAVIVFAVIASLAKFGVETTSFVAVLGAVGFAVGFALQGSLSNFAAGVMMMIFKPIKVGDLVESCGKTGTVTEIGLFVTCMDTVDNQHVIVPNAKLTGDVIVNVNGNDLRRVDLAVGISYGDDIARAKQVCLDAMRSHPKVLQDPEPYVGVSGMGDSSVDLVVRPWSTGEDYWDVYFDVNQAVKEGLDRAGITIPFPQRDVHMVSSD